MALSVDFSTTQALGTPGRITITDDSTGSDADVVSRRITFTDNAGNTHVVEGTTTAYELWPIADDTITLDLIEEDWAFNVKVQWLNSSNVALYQKTTLILFPLFLKTYYIGLIKSQSSNRKLIDHANFYDNEVKLLCSIQEATNAVNLADDIGSAQAALYRGKTLIDNPSNFF
jgi:hypothetical protein